MHYLIFILQLIVNRRKRRNNLHDTDGQKRKLKKQKNSFLTVLKKIEPQPKEKFELLKKIVKSKEEGCGSYQLS